MFSFIIYGIYLTRSLHRHSIHYNENDLSHYITTDPWNPSYEIPIDQLELGKFSTTLIKSSYNFQL